MELRNGTYRFGPEHGGLLLKTSRTGFGRKAGHDLTIRVGAWNADVTVDLANPQQSQVQATIQADSFEILHGTGGLKPLTSGDRADIRATIAAKVLKTADHPAITFVSTQVSGTPDAFTLIGELTIMGRSQPVEMTATAGTGRLQGRAVITQTRWGIKPYSAFAGALRLADDVRLEFDLAIP
jgi:polyisoprenoid-binding protein YceI